MDRTYDRDYAGGGLGRDAFGGYIREGRHRPRREYLRGYDPDHVAGTYRRDPYYDRDYMERDYEYDYEYQAGYGRTDGPRSRPAYAEFWRVSGPHSGRGPRGYRRSPERIKDEVADRLSMHGLIDATDIEVHVEEDEVTLSGTVDSRRAKRMADDVAASVAGVHDVHNRLTVRREASPRPDRSSRGAAPARTAQTAGDKASAET